MLADVLPDTLLRWMLNFALPAALQACACLGPIPFIRASFLSPRVQTLIAVIYLRERQEELLRMLPVFLGEYMLRCHVGMQLCFALDVVGPPAEALSASLCGAGEASATARAWLGLSAPQATELTAAFAGCYRYTPSNKGTGG
jgi:hypothetical protein